MLSAILNENLKQDLSKAMEITWKGILAIFIVIAIVIVAVMVMSFITRKLDENKAKKEEAKRLANEQNQSQG